MEWAASVGTGGTNTVLADRAFGGRRDRGWGLLCMWEGVGEERGPSREGDEKVAGDQGLKCHVEFPLWCHGIGSVS